MLIRERYPVGSRICVHCSSPEEASELFALLEGEGYKWASGTFLRPERTWWENYEEEMCYSLKDPDHVTYGNIWYFKCNNWEVVEASEIIGEEKGECSQELSDFLCGLMSK